MKKKIVSISIATFLFSSGIGLSANALSPVPNTEPSASITSCIAKNHKLEALMVVDESLSLVRTKGPGGKRLPGTDIGDERVTALKAVTQVLLDKVNDIDPNRQTEVSVALAGFGNSYELHQDWMELKTGTAQSFLEVIGAQSKRESSQFTRYHKALGGALATFEKIDKGDSSSCRMLIWFSDGQHDDNDAGNEMSSAEEDQIGKQICGPDGFADKLRLQGVYTIAAGLNENRNAFGLMQLVSQGNGDVKLKKGILTSCGVVKPEGKFAVASGAGDLVATLVNLIDPGPPPPVTEPCRVGEILEPNCSQISFVVDSRVSRFTLFVDRGDDDVIATLESEQTGRTTLFGTIQDPNIQQTILSDNGAYIRVARKQDGAINGRWTLKFNGFKHKDARALVRFVGEAEVKISSVSSDGKKNSARAIDRYETEEIRIAVTSKTGGTSLEGARVEFKTRNGLIEVNTFSEAGEVVIPSEVLQSVLRNGELKDALETELLVTPLGTVEGITNPETGKNMPIDFGTKSFKLRVTNGTGFPEYLGLDAKVKGVDATGAPVLKGTNKKLIGFRFKGASASDAEVLFSDIESDVEFKFVSGEKCIVKKAQETTCELEIKALKDSNGFHAVTVKTLSSIKGSEKSQTGSIPIEIETLKPNNPWNGIKIALLLVLSFLIIQGLQRFFFAWLISRFGAVSPTARRARIDILVSSSGDVSGSSGSRLAVKTGDESFVFENTEATTQFHLFGYEFVCSAWNTFKHSTSMPLGKVIKNGSFVFGSAGVQTPKKSQLLEQGTDGLVELSLRGQWVIGIENSDLIALTGGASQVPAELVIYLSPFEQVSLEQQLSEISFSISAGRFPGLLSEVSEKVRSAIEDSVVVAEPTDPGETWAGKGQEFDPLDPFGLSNNSQSEVALEEKEKVSFFSKMFSIFSRKKKSKSEESIVENDSGSSGSGSSYLDPFS